MNIILDNYWTVQDICDAYGVVPMTVHNWRLKLGLPCTIIPGRERNAVRFKKKEVERWAKKHGKKKIKDVV